MSVVLSPSDSLGFRRPLTQLVHSTLVLANPNAHAIAFKWQTTAPKQYSVRPKSGRLEAGEKVEVEVTMQPLAEDPPETTLCRDKLLVQSILITEGRKSLEVADLWKAAEQDQTQIVKTRLACAYLQVGELTKEERKAISVEKERQRKKNMPYRMLKNQERKVAHAEAARQNLPLRGFRDVTLRRNELVGRINAEDASTASDLLPSETSMVLDEAQQFARKDYDSYLRQIGVKSTSPMTSLRLILYFSWVDVDNTNFADLYDLLKPEVDSTCDEAIEESALSLLQCVVEEDSQYGGIDADAMDEDSAVDSKLSFTARFRSTLPSMPVENPFTDLRTIDGLFNARVQAADFLASQSGVGAEVQGAIESACLDAAMRTQSDRRAKLQQARDNLAVVEAYQEDMIRLRIAPWPMDERKICLHFARRFDSRHAASFEDAPSIPWYRIYSLMNAFAATKKACPPPPKSHCDSLVASLRHHIRMIGRSVAPPQAPTLTTSVTPDELLNAVGVFCSSLAQALPAGQDEPDLSHITTFAEWSASLEQLNARWAAEDAVRRQ